MHRRRFGSRSWRRGGCLGFVLGSLWWAVVNAQDILGLFAMKDDWESAKEAVGPILATLGLTPFEWVVFAVLAALSVFGWPLYDKLRLAFSGSAKPYQEGPLAAPADPQPVPVPEPEPEPAPLAPPKRMVTTEVVVGESQFNRSGTWHLWAWISARCLRDTPAFVREVHVESKGVRCPIVESHYPKDLTFDPLDALPPNEQKSGYVVFDCGEFVLNRLFTLTVEIAGEEDFVFRCRAKQRPDGTEPALQYDVEEVTEENSPPTAEERVKPEPDDDEPS